MWGVPGRADRPRGARPRVGAAPWFGGEPNRDGDGVPMKPAVVTRV